MGGWPVRRCRLKNKQNKHGFHFQNHGTTTKKQAIFLNHVDLGVIELKALTHTHRKKKVQTMEMIGQKKNEKEIMYE